MSLDKVKQEIREQAEQKADDIVSEARQRADTITADAEEQADEIRKQHEQELEQEKEQLRRRELSTARREARNRELQAKQSVLDEIFAAFRQHVRDLDADEQEELFQQAIASVQDEASIGTVITSEEMADTVRDRVDADVEVRDVEGLIIENEDGTLRYDYTFETIIETIEDRKRREIASEIF